ncbi:MAG: VOC family protein [Acidimicrobiales bacterium]
MSSTLHIEKSGHPYDKTYAENDYRLHLDLINVDPSAVDDLMSLGATVVSRTDWGLHGWAVMQDPEGNEFDADGKSWRHY